MTIKRNEQLEQAALFQWARMPAVLMRHPELRLLSASLNGVRLHPRQAKNAKAAGMLAGEHDIRLPVARGRYHCLSIEMKVNDNVPTDNQLKYGELLEAEGGCVRYCWSWLEAREAIEEYLALPKKGAGEGK